MMRWVLLLLLALAGPAAANLIVGTSGTLLTNNAGTVMLTNNAGTVLLIK